MMMTTAPKTSSCCTSTMMMENLVVASIVIYMDVQDVFSAEIPSGLPSIRGIEHHIDLNPGGEFDSKTYPFEEGRNDRYPTNKAKDPLHDTRGFLTRPKTNIMKQSLQDLSVRKNEKFDS
ncbi:hypothetical protein CR513_28638, partial [Mucuna pruriens]